MTEGSFESQLRRAIVESERLRVLIAAGFIGFLFVGFLAFTSFSPGLLDSLFHGQVRRDYVAGVLLLAAAFELLVAWHLGNVLLQDRDLIRPLRYLHTFVEISGITLVFIFEFGVFHPLIALAMPTLFAYFVIIILSTLRLDFRLSVFAGFVAGAQYLCLASYAVRVPLPPGFEPIMAAMPQHFGKGVLLMVSGFLAGLVGHELRRQITRLFRAQEDRQRVVDVFGRHVSPAVVNKLLEQSTELASETRHVCVMFLDIRNFTTFSERRSPAEVVSFLNQLFGFMIEEVNRHHGIVNKFLGDGFMAVFGAPLSDGRDCRNAVDASLAILAKLEALVAAGTLPLTRVGIGLHAGEAVTGTVGSPERKEYTVIGDVVNLASRIESLNKELDAQVLCSSTVFESAGGVQGTPRGPMKVKGREEAVQIVQLA